MFEIGELAQFRLRNGIKIKGSILAIPERTELGINLAAAIHLDFCDLRGQPLRDRVFLQPLPNLWDGFIPFRVNVDLASAILSGTLMGIQCRSQSAFLVHQDFHNRQLEVEAGKGEHWFSRLG